MLERIVHSLKPELRGDEARKFGLLALLFSLIIGGYWLLRLLKNTIFVKIAFPMSLGWPAKFGATQLPNAKGYSLLVVFIMIIIYSSLVDKFKKHQLFYIISTFYGILFLSLGSVLMIAHFYGPESIGKIPLATAGWVSYFVIESFGSLVVALFWSFTNSITKPESAKSGFPLIISWAGVGAIIGSAVLLFAKKITIWPIPFATALIVFSIIPFVRYFMKHVPEDQMVGYKPENKSTQTTDDQTVWSRNPLLKTFKSFFSGLTLLLSRPYLLGIFVVATFYEAVGHIVEYQMTRQGELIFESSTAFAQFQGLYGVVLNTLSFLIALLGTSYIIKRFGVRVALMIYPVSFGIILISLYFFATYAGASVSQLFWFTFGSMAIIKALGYAVSNPTKEMMYIPTSKTAKFKSKGWIDMFGSRSAKFGGSRVTDALKGDLSALMTYGSLIGIILIGIWTMAAYYVGRKNKKLVDEGQVVD